MGGQISNWSKRIMIVFSLESQLPLVFLQI